MLITTQPAVKFAGFSREREIRIREIRRVGREERHQERYDAGSNPTPFTNIGKMSEDVATRHKSLDTQKRHGEPFEGHQRVR